MGFWSKVRQAARSVDPTSKNSSLRQGLSKFDPTTAYGRRHWADPWGLYTDQGQSALHPELPMMGGVYGLDPFDVMLREAALNTIRQKQRSDRMASFYTGPRGLEGPAKTVLG